MEHDFEESVGYWVVMTAHAFQKRLREELAPHGITYRQFQVLAWLAIEKCLSQAELAEKMNIEPPTLVTVLARMERDGWITRTNCTADRRKRLVRATRRAEPVWEQGMACARRVREQASVGLSTQQVDLAKQLLREMRDNLSTEVALCEDKR